MKTKRFYGWYIVAVCFLIMLFIYTPYVTLAGIFLKPITEDLNIPRTAFALGSTISSLVGGLFHQLLGRN